MQFWSRAVLYSAGATAWSGRRGTPRGHPCSVHARWASAPPARRRIGSLPTCRRVSALVALPCLRSQHRDAGTSGTRRTNGVLD